MSTPRIERITITYGSAKPRKKPRAGDEKVVKGVTYIRQHSRVPEGIPHAGAYIYNGSHPRFEWVVKGSEDDRSARRHKGGDA